MTSRSSETRSDVLPARRDEVAAQLHRLAELVQHDRWEEAGKLMDTAHDDFMSVFAAWNKLRFKRNLERNAGYRGHIYGFTADVRRHAP